MADHRVELVPEPPIGSVLVEDNGHQFVHLDNGWWSCSCDGFTINFGWTEVLEDVAPNRFRCSGWPVRLVADQQVYCPDCEADVGTYVPCPRTLGCPLGSDDDDG